MSKRKILAACKRKGITLDDVRYEWTPTPGESVPCYVILLSDASAELYGEDHMQIFDNVAQVFEWIDELKPYAEVAAAP